MCGDIIHYYSAGETFGPGCGSTSKILDLVKRRTVTATKPKVLNWIRGRNNQPSATTGGAQD